MIPAEGFFFGKLYTIMAWELRNLFLKNLWYTVLLNKKSRWPVTKEIIYLNAFSFSKEELTLYLVSKRKSNKAENQR